MAKKYTPAPWGLHERKPLQVIGSLVTPKDTAFASFYPGICRLDLNSTGTYVSMSNEERLANAQLIASAPELLEALQELLRVVEEEDNNSFYVIQDTKQAIAKALGTGLIKQATGI